MRFILGLTILVATLAFGTSMKCQIEDYDIKTEWNNMSSRCIEMVRVQIKAEVNAALQYLLLGAQFSRDTYNRPGFSKFFFEAAKEERDHAMHLIDYLTMRGQLHNATQNLLTTNVIKKTVTTGEEALQLALKAEVEVTESIKSVIETCEKVPNDYHLVDYLTGVFLEEQYKGQRDIAGKLTTLGKMMRSHGQIGEFLFDKTLL